MPPTAVTSNKKADLSDFLKSRRARVKPADVGLPEYGRRNTPGLRREEVSVLAGVSTSWYTWFEQGRDIRVSASVLDAICVALRLDETDRVYLYGLADMNPPAVATAASGKERSLLARIADEMASPAFVVDRHWRLLFVNTQAQTLLHLEQGPRAFLEYFFLDLEYRTLVVNWAEMAECFVGSLRVRAGVSPEDAGLVALVDTLSADQVFRDLWQEHSTSHRKARKVVIKLPDGSHKEFDAAAMDLSGCDDLQLISYLPRAAG